MTEIQHNCAIVFDMDGVIFDSEKLVIQSWQETAAIYGIAGVEQVCRACIGQNAAAAREVFLREYGEDFPYDTLKPQMSARFRAHRENGELALKPGVREILGALKNHGWRTALASSTRRAVVEEELEMFGLREWFDEVIGGDACPRSKPAPDIFLAACKSLRADPACTIAVEDSYNGIRAAHAAGMLPVMIPDMLEPTDEMRGMAYKILPDLFALEALLFAK